MAGIAIDLVCAQTATRARPLLAPCDAVPAPLARAPMALGDSLLCIVGEGRRGPAGGDEGPGWRYLTVQVRHCRQAHAGVLARGGTEGRGPPVCWATRCASRWCRIRTAISSSCPERARLVGGLS